MGILDKLKKPEEKKEIKKEVKEDKVGKRSSASYSILKGPHITEKATDLSEKGNYVFKVYPNANKIEIKKAVESLYGVNVVSVRIINIPKKKRRLGRTEGFRSGYKKAIVCVKEGQKIELMPR